MNDTAGIRLRGPGGLWLRVSRLSAEMGDRDGVEEVSGGDRRLGLVADSIGADREDPPGIKQFGERAADDVLCVLVAVGSCSAHTTTYFAWPLASIFRATCSGRM